MINEDNDDDVSGHYVCDDNEREVFEDHVDNGDSNFYDGDVDVFSTTRLSL